MALAERREQDRRAKARARRNHKVMIKQAGYLESEAPNLFTDRMIGMRARTRTFGSQEDRSRRGAHRRNIEAANCRELLQDRD